MLKTSLTESYNFVLCCQLFLSLLSEFCIEIQTNIFYFLAFGCSRGEKDKESGCIACGDTDEEAGD